MNKHIRKYIYRSIKKRGVPIVYGSEYCNGTKDYFVVEKDGIQCTCKYCEYSYGCRAFYSLEKIWNENPKMTLNQFTAFIDLVCFSFGVGGYEIENIIECGKNEKKKNNNVS